MIFWNKICGFGWIFLFIGVHSSAQATISFKPGKAFPHLENKLIFLNIYAPQITKTDKIPAPFYSKSPIPENFSTLSYGFFCRKELAIERATKIPFRFRLGSLEQCNYYEGKRQ